MSAIRWKLKTFRIFVIERRWSRFSILFHAVILDCRIDHTAWCNSHETFWSWWLKNHYLQICNCERHAAMEQRFPKKEVSVVLSSSQVEVRDVYLYHFGWTASDHPSPPLFGKAMLRSTKVCQPLGRVPICFTSVGPYGPGGVLSHFEGGRMGGLQGVF